MWTAAGAVGSAAGVVGFAAMALGFAAMTLGFAAVKVGNAAVALGFAAVVVGNAAVALGFAAGALGFAAVVVGNAAVALGFAARALGFATGLVGERPRPSEPPFGQRRPLQTASCSDERTRESQRTPPCARRPAAAVIGVTLMVKVARRATGKTAQPAPRRKLFRIYTAWHPVLVVLLEHVVPAGFYQCISEFQLSREPLRIDVVVVRRSRPGTPPAPRLLASVVGDLADHTLVHFKGPTDELERDDARMLFAYALQYLVVAELDDPALVALRVVASRLTPRFVEALSLLGCALTTNTPGVHEGRLGVFPLRVIETIPVNARAGEHLLYTVTPGMLADPGGVPALSAEESEVFYALQEHVEQLRHPLPGQKRRHMKDEDKVVRSFEEAMVGILARMSPEQRLAGLPVEQRLAGLAPEQRLAGLPVEQRLAGLAPEQRLAGLAPEQRLAGLPVEQRLAGLTEAQAVLALPEAMLRGLSSEYLATLPPETRAAVQKRLGGAAASPRKPSRPRKAR